jgi:hypothetical protein
MQRLLNYRGPDPDVVAPRSGLRKMGAIIGGFALGVPTGVGTMIAIGSLLPNGGRAQTSSQANVAFFVGLAIAGGGFVPLAWSKWFFAGLAVGTGIGVAALAFLIGIMSGITC